MADHPYKKYENLQVWRVLKQGVEDLQTNGDLEEKTARTHIIGYLCKLLDEAGLIGSSAPVAPQEDVSVSSGPLLGTVPGYVISKKGQKQKVVRTKPTES